MTRTQFDLSFGVMNAIMVEKRIIQKKPHDVDVRFFNGNRIDQQCSYIVTRSVLKEYYKASVPFAWCSIVHSPKSKVRSPKSKVRSPKSEVQSMKSKVRSPKSEVQSPKSKIQSLKSKVQSLKSEVQNS